MSPPQETKLFRMSIRQVTHIGVLCVAIPALVASIALITITTTLQRDIDTVVRDTRSQALASQLELNLLSYQRLSNLFILTQEPNIDNARRPLVSQMRRSLAVADDYAGNTRELELLSQVTRNLSAYLEDREKVDAESPGLREAVSATRSSLNNALSSMESLRELNRSQVIQAQSSAERLDDIANLIGWIVAAMLIIGLLLVALGVRRYVLQPILSLHGAVSQFRAGEFGARSTAEGPHEIAQLAHGFNEMANSLAHQRQEQLTYLAGVAHDLRNPLNGIKLGLYAIEQEQSPGKRARVRERLARQVEHLSRMVDDLIDATRIEAGTLELREEVFDLRGVVEDMVHLYEPTSLAHQIVTEQPPEPVIIRGDPLRMEQVISNLLSNAIKFSPGDGQITVNVGVENGEAIVAVADRGIGILPEEIPDLFLPFRRRPSDVIPGSGLGLSVVRRIVVAHGGSIEVDSEPGLGTTFRIKVPLASDQRANDPPSSE